MILHKKHYFRTLIIEYGLYIPAQNPYNYSVDISNLRKRGESMIEMPTDMQYKDGLRKDKFLNDLIIEAIKNGDTEKALEYLEKDNERINKALEE